MLRSALSTTLTGTAKLLQVGSRLLDAGAALLRQPDRAEDGDGFGDAHGAGGLSEPVFPSQDPGSSTADAIAAVEDSGQDVGRVVEPAATPLLDDTPHLRTSESHIAELAERPAPDVIKAVADLSTDELRLLTEHELAHRNRKTVLRAVEEALLPTAPA